VEALQVGNDGGQPDASLIFGGHLIDLNIQRGTLGDLVDVLDQLAADAPDVAGVLTGTLTLAHAEAGRFDDVGRLLGQFAAAGYELPLDSLWATGMTYYAEAAYLSRDRTHSGALLDQLAPFADQWASTGANVEGPVSHFLGALAGVLGRDRESDDYFARAAAASTRVSAKFFTARTNLVWGETLARRDGPGDAERARERLRSAQRLAAAQGYGAVERRAADVLAAL
jgi:ABC-type transporter Mla subunit MlaD